MQTYPNVSDMNSGAVMGNENVSGVVMGHENFYILNECDNII